MNEQDTKRAARGLSPVGTVKPTECSHCAGRIAEVIGRSVDGGTLCWACGRCCWNDCHEENTEPGGPCPGCAGRIVDDLEFELREARSAPGPRSCWAEVEREVRALIAVRDLRGLTEPLKRRLHGLCAWDRAAAEAIGAWSPDGPSVIGCVWGAHRRLVDDLGHTAPTYAWCEEQWATLRRAAPSNDRLISDWLTGRLHDLWTAGATAPVQLDLFTVRGRPMTVDVPTGGLL